MSRQNGIRVEFNGVDISASLSGCLLSLTYIDNEEDESDDLQIKIEDREGTWLRHYIPEAVSSAASKAPVASTEWQIGDSVTVTGTPQYSSYGIGIPGKPVSGHRGKVTHLNLKDGIPYPIHVDHLGWFTESEVQKEEGSGPQPGLKIRAFISGLPCGEFELDSVDASGPPSTVTIKALGLPPSVQLRATKQTRAWEAYTLSGIAEEIATANGMTCFYDAPEDPAYTRVEQQNVSDIDFLAGLCKDAGLSLKATSRSLVLFDQAAYEAKAPMATIGYGGGYTKYRLSMGAADVKYSSCRVSYVDPATGECIEATARIEDYAPNAKGNQQLEISAKVASIGEAKTLAEKQLRIHNKYAKTASFTFPGAPSLVAGVTVRLRGWGSWNGKYMISRATHSVSSRSGYTTQIELRRVLEGY